VGEVVASEDPELSPGDLVLHGFGWRKYALSPARGARKIDASIAPPQAYLGVLGMPGLTAYAGLIEVAGLREDDVVFVSGAAGAVGGIAGQIAKLRGHHVIGSAGSLEKVEYATGELGFDRVFDYHDGPVAELLAEAAPDGIDVYFDNVGGDHLEAAIGALNQHGRVALCGAISQYNAKEPAPGPRNLHLAVGKRLTLRGFIVRDHRHLMGDFVREVGTWLSEGRIRYRETVVEGLENAPQAFIGLLRGDNVGKMLVRVGGE
jgi:NADPH-dependent curcumin reductase CurA